MVILQPRRWLALLAGCGQNERRLVHQRRRRWRESPDEKACYTHAFVVLGASSAAVAGLNGAVTCSPRHSTCGIMRFFDAESGMFVDSWNRGFTELMPTEASMPTCMESSPSSPLRM